MLNNNPNIIRLNQVSDEEGELLFSKEIIYAKEDMPCPWCQCMTLSEDTYGYEKVVSCSHCPYSQTKTI